MNILWLGDASCSDQELTGGKAANLSVLAERFPVPSGFCITSNAFSLASKARSDFEPLPNSQAHIPNSLREEILSAYLTLADRTESDPLRVAVRSSAADEDGLEASFAGQHETFLNVVGEGALLDAVRGCWASAFSEQAMAYRRSHGQQSERIQIGVLVQQLVPADTSLVLFSSNPLNHNSNQMMINASWGLGESVVSGHVTPDVFVVNKSNFDLIEQTISQKTEMTVQGDTHTESVMVPRFLQNTPSLNYDQIKQVAELGKTLEGQMGWPVDIECAFHGEKLYLLQCRPITTLSP